MAIPRLHPGDQVSITIDGTVDHAEPGQIELSSRTLVAYEHDHAISVDLVRDGFRIGDVIYDGRRHLMRTATGPGSDGACWTASDGTQVPDNDVNPDHVAIVAPLAA